MASVAEGDPGASDTSFIEDSVKELLKARRVLRASYPYGYYLQVQVWSNRRNSCWNVCRNVNMYLGLNVNVSYFFCQNLSMKYESNL